ncbi:MAG: TonB-dependent receptor [Bryobacterales bacterium]|nr:TonB-dependent receptor [Bryobacterales bacterium]
MRIFVLLCLVPASLQAQLVTATLSGYVRDASHAFIPGAAVTATASSAGLTVEARANAAGYYRLPALAPGRYTVTATHDGFAPQREEVTLTLDARLRLDFTLAPEAGATSITVAELVSESLSTGLTLDRARLAGLPLNRRDFLQLSLLAPGVVPPVPGSELSTDGSFAMHASGAREEFNNFTIDGADNNDGYTNRYVLQPPVESIAEFRVLTGSYTAEYGRNAGAQVNVLTRSGTNAFHGAVYEYLRNRRLDARNFFDAAANPKYARNQAGASLGGPIRKDRAFFFANYEGLRERQGITRLATVPTAAQRAGDLSADGAPVIDPFTQQPFPNARIPAARISPLAPRVLALFPAASSGAASGNLLAQPVLRDTLDQAIVRFDQRLATHGDLTLRYGYGRGHRYDPFSAGAATVPGFGNFNENSGHNLTAQHTHTLSPSAVWTLRAAFARSFREARQENHATNVGAAWGVNWLNVPPRDFGYPSMEIAGLSSIGDADLFPLRRSTTAWQAQPSLQLLRGAHALRFGADLRRFRAHGYLDYFARGSLNFSGALTTSGVADLLLGLPILGIQAQFDNRQDLRTHALNFYAQDDWRLAPRLTLTLGLRYEYNSPPTDPDGRMYALNPATMRLERTGANGVPRGGLRPDRNNFAPRIGLAWTPVPRTTLRAGYGFFHDANMLVVSSSLYFNPPLFNIRVFFPSEDSLLTLNDPFPTGGGFAPPPSPTTISPDLRTASLQHWNLAIERELDAATSLSLGYVGSKGTHLNRSRDLNQPAPGPGVVDERRPSPDFGSIFFTESGGNSIYHSLQALVNRRLARRVSLLASYTWAKSIDDASAFLATNADANFPQNSRDYAAERARSSFDVSHRLSAAAVFEAPFGIVLRTITTAQTGAPFTPILRFDNSNTGNASGNNGYDRPDVSANPRLDARTPERWFDTGAFSPARPFTFGNAGRNIVEAPGLVNFDVSAARLFRLTETLRLTVEAQMFNLTNTAHFNLPERYADEPSTFGRILSARSPRQLQFALRLHF